MIKKFQIFIIVFLLLIIIIFFTPVLVLNNNTVRATLSDALANKLNIHTNLEQISWAWFPWPHISVTDTRFSNKQLEISLPHVSIYPDWWKVLSGKIIITGIALDNPRIQVATLKKVKNNIDTPTFSKSNLTFPLSSPVRSIIINNGSLLLPIDGFLQPLSQKLVSFDIFNANISVKIDAEQIKLGLDFLHPLAGHFFGTCTLLPLREKTEFKKNSSWDLNLHGKKVNLTEIREYILLLWGDNAVVKQTCDIVQKGFAKKVDFLFKGPTKDLSSLDVMTITADVDNATIQVPEIDMHLNNTNGKIKIKNSILSGWDLSARMNNSYLKEGTLELDIDEADRIFKLKANIDANLADLQVELSKLIKNKKFRTELAGISKIKGKAWGHLRLGNTLKDMNVYVNVSKIIGNAMYKRLRYPVLVENASLQVLPDQVIWDNLKGVVGPHVINNSKGSVSIGNRTILNIENLDATLDSALLFSELQSYPLIHEELSQIINSIEGPLEIKNIRVNGPASTPQNWEYSLEAGINKLKLSSPALTDPFLIETASIQADHKTVQLLECSVNILDSIVTLTGNLTHTSLHKWLGSLDLSGTIYHKAAEQIMNAKWIPDLYFPGIPFSMNPLKITWMQKKTDISGNIVSKKFPETPVHAIIDLSISDDNIAIQDLAITAGNKMASLSLNFQATPEKHITMDFSGYMGNDILNKALEKNKFVTGHITGACHINYNEKDPASFCFEGPLELSGFNWPISNRDIQIERAEITGHGSWADIKNISFVLNKETIHAEGNVKLANSDIELDLDINSDALSWNNLTRLMKSTENDSEFQLQQPAFSITGNIDFILETFNYFSAPQKSVSDNASYTWNPLSGSIQLLPKGKTAITISSGKLCNLNTTGSWQSASNRATLSVYTNNDELANFRDLLSCLEMKENSIEGTFNLKSDLQWEHGQWNKGSFLLQSQNGKLIDMPLFTKMLSVINVTDLFSKRGVQDFFSKGFSYTDMEITGYVKENKMIINRAVIKGDGLNLFATGTINLDKMDMDVTVLVAPFKSLDSIVSFIPVIGKAIESENNAIITFPVRIKGPLKNPSIIYESENTVGDAIKEMIKSTINIPFRILGPIVSEEKGTQ